ncbi:penicillin-binding protein 2 [Brevundimonas sp. 2R-24]|uniref:Penicillin-binding protein 2 n=1 Tax=Peiella sedimenti TaxID=3061083 RepID=A0ABT8SNQ5_9CAUL|nr:penicillin-binding protein 2 [Caulobacteraceae bacterium XZ-24]
MKAPIHSRPRLNLPSFHWLTDRVWRVEHAFERAKAADRPEEDTRVRIFIVMAAFCAVFVALSLGAARAALFSGEGEGRSAALAAGPGRADLVDRNGLLLAGDLTHYGLYVDPGELWDAVQVRRALVQALPDKDLKRLDRVLAGGRRGFVIGGLTPQERERVHALALGGVTFEPEPRRAYPLGESAAHLIGFSDTGGRGLAGAEKAFDEQIRAAGRDGQAFPLSVDLRIQAVLESELAAAAMDQQAIGGVGIVTNARTGEILAMASWPSFDPNHIGESPPEARLNRAAASVFEMGSTFKTFTIAAGLDAGAARPDSVFDATQPLRMGNRLIHDFHAENRAMTLEDVFIHSSNIGTARLALTLGEDVMVGYFRRLGLLEAAPIELAESARPLLPRAWNDSNLASASFGHAIMVSPLQVVAAMGAVANGGVYVPLTLRRLDRGPEGRRVIAETTSRQMLDLLRANALRGSGTRANPPGLRVGGKTGSAEKVINGRYDRTRGVSSYAAVFPTDGPPTTDRYVVLILLDEPHGSAASFGLRTAGFTAAPAAGRVIDRIAPFVNVQRREEIAPPAPMPVAEEPTGGVR